MSRDPQTTQLTEHARTRWMTRADVSALEDNFVPRIREAFDESISIGVDDVTGKARLHPPTKTLFAIDDGVVKTVLCFHDHEVEDDHLVVCENCGLRYDPGQSEDCPWHESVSVDEVWDDTSDEVATP